MYPKNIIMSVVISSLLVWISFASRQDFELRILNSGCHRDPDYADCNLTLRDTSHFDLVVHLKQVFYSGLLFKLEVLQVNPHGKSSIIYNHTYDVGEKGARLHGGYGTAFLMSLINDFFGDELKYPVQAKNYSVQNFGLDNQILPIHWFYKPKVYFWANATFYHLKENLRHFFGSVYFKVAIVKIHRNRTRKNKVSNPFMGTGLDNRE